MTTTANMTERRTNRGVPDSRIAWLKKSFTTAIRSAMYTAAYRITNDFELADDVLQDAFIKSIPPPKGIPAGIYPRCLDQDHCGTYCPVQGQEGKSDREPCKIIISKAKCIDWGHHIEVDYLEKAIQALLPAGYRSVFVLIEVEGYSHQEVAKLLDISVGTSKSQLFYAKRKLRQALKKFRH
jgi:hypothetical protein